MPGAGPPSRDRTTRRVLVVSFVFPPMVAGGAPRWAQLCKYLPEHGWMPTVLTAQVGAAPAPDGGALAELPAGVRVVRAWCPLAGAAPRGAPNASGGVRGALRRGGRALERMLFFPDRQVLWAPFAVRAGLAALRAAPHDAVVATFGPGTNLLVGRRLALAASLPLVVDFRDLWADLPTAEFPTRWHRAAAERMERRTVAASRKVVGVSPAMAAHLASRHGRDENDVVSIPNGFDPADAARVKDSRPAGGAPFRLCYVGSVYGAYDLGPFFAAIAELDAGGVIAPESFRVEFVGNLSQDVPRRSGVERYVDISPPVPHAGVFDVLNRSDAHLVVENPSYWSKFSYPAKVFDYLLTGKPILGLVDRDGNCGRLLRDAGVGVIAAPGDREGIERALRSLLARRGEAPRFVEIERAPMADFDRRRLSRRMAEVLDSAC